MLRQRQHAEGPFFRLIIPVSVGCWIFLFDVGSFGLMLDLGRTSAPLVLPAFSNVSLSSPPRPLRLHRKFQCVPILFRFARDWCVPQSQTKWPMAGEKQRFQVECRWQMLGTDSVVFSAFCSSWRAASPPSKQKKITKSPDSSAACSLSHG